MDIDKIEIGKCYKYGNRLFIAKEKCLSPTRKKQLRVEYIEVGENHFFATSSMTFYAYDIQHLKLEEIEVDIFYRLLNLYKVCFSSMNSIFPVESKKVYGKDGKLIKPI